MIEKYQTDYTEPKFKFLKELSNDLNKIDFLIRIRKNKSKINITFGSNFNYVSNHKDLIAIRNEQIKKNISFFKKMEKEKIDDLFIDGHEIDIKNIKPVIEICATKKQKDIYKYCKYFQSIPSSDRVGRELKVLVFDKGQNRKVLMGAFCLASSLFNLGCRDKYLQWSGKKNLNKKISGLKKIMDLSICLAVPPYSYLLGGKLIAMLAFSKVVTKEFKRKYGTDLLAIFTTCAKGGHCPIFNRIMIKQGGLFKKIGMTKGFTTTIFDKQTLTSVRKLLKSEGIEYGNHSVLRNPMKDLRAALNCCNVPENRVLMIGNPKAVYCGMISKRNHLSFENETGNNCKTNYSLSKINEYWLNNVLIKKNSDKTTLDRVYLFNKNNLKLSEIGINNG